MKKNILRIRKLKIENFPMFHRGGFTLIELLVVLSLVALITVAAGNIFYSTLRTNTKTQVSANLKQKGNYALAVMERMIREAKEIPVCQDRQLTLVYKDDLTTTFSCSSSQIASSSAHSSVLVSPIDCANFDFTCNLPQVGINFTLNRNPTNPLPFKRSEIQFQTTVTARNL
jgi:prepilin-type N-terminal cleavage/methylation domain-containing protein